MKEALSVFLLFLANKITVKFNSCSKKKEALSVFCLVILLLSFLEAPVTKPNFGNFIECLGYQTSPENPITDAIFIADNTTTFLSSYVSYTKNKRFSSPNYKKLLAIVAAKHVSHVQATVVCAKSNGIQIRIRSGGHDNEGLSYTSSVPFVILDMHNLRSIAVDLSSKKAWVQAGATLGELYVKINEASETLAFPAGVCPTVGTGGHISGGGFGNLMRKYGVTVDQVIDAQLVDANGKLLNRATMGEDLFWAIRGGGSSFGVILSWKINLVDVPTILTVFKVNKTLEQGGTDVLYKWQLVANKLPDSLFITAWPRTVNGVKPGEKTIAVVFYAQFLGPTDKLMEIMNQSFPELELGREDCHEMSWLSTTLFWANYPAGTPKSVLLDRPPTNSISFKSKSDFVKTPIPIEGLEKLWKTMFKFNHSVSLQFNPYGGVMDRIPATDTAFPHRQGNLFKVQYSTMWLDVNATESSLVMMKELFEVAEPYVSSNPREAFFNFRDMDIGSNPSGETDVGKAKIYGYKYFLGNLKRLMQVKAKYDPDNFFKNEQSIPPVRVM